MLPDQAELQLLFARFNALHFGGTIPPYRIAYNGRFGNLAGRITYRPPLIELSRRHFERYPEKLAETFAAYLQAKVRAGADVIQLFDSWVGALSPEDYREFVAPYSARILDAIDVPTIHFGTGTAHLLRDMKAVGGDVIGLDWRVPIDRGWEYLGSGRGVRGNLDPALLLGPWKRTEEATDRILDAVAGRRGHIFNLGHGVVPQTPPEHVAQLVEIVRNWKPSTA